MPRPRCRAMVSASWCRRRMKSGWLRARAMQAAAAAQAELEVAALAAARAWAPARGHNWSAAAKRAPAADGIRAVSTAPQRDRHHRPGERTHLETLRAAATWPFRL